jgi:hypothetical protein
MTHDQTECTVKSNDVSQALEAHRDETGTVHLGVRRLQHSPSKIEEVVALSGYDAYRLGEYLAGSTLRRASSDPESTHVIPTNHVSRVPLVHDSTAVLPSADGSKERQAGRVRLEPLAASYPLHERDQSPCACPGRCWTSGCRTR